MANQITEQLWLYNNWANETVFKAFDTYGAGIPSSSLRLLSHIVNVQHVWLTRITQEPASVKIWDEHRLADCRKIHEESSRSIKDLMEKYAGDPYAEIDYANSQGTPFRNTVFDILFQVFNHGTYHRAQIAMDMRKNGLNPVNTDYITFVRLNGSH